MDKSIDTLMLELEEKEIQTKLMRFGQSFTTESEALFERDDRSISKIKNDGESVVINEDVNSNLNVQNLNNQFRFNHVIQAIHVAKNTNLMNEVKAQAISRQNQIQEELKHEDNKR